ncbi:MAG: trigger factor [Rickettsiales bacterium]|nr:trigger factor [Rickettsiales bacterium]
MKIDELNSKGLDREWKVTIPASLVNEKLSAKYIEISNTAKLPGFRPGKVPINLVKQKYSQSVMPNVLDEIINTSIRKAVKDKNIQPSVQPKIDVKKFEEGSELIFNVSFQIMPEIADINFKEISFEKSELDIKDDDIEKALIEVAEKHERFLPLEKKRKSKKGDLILFDFEGKVSGKKFPGNKGKDETVVLGSNKYIPGYEDQMINLEIGESKVIKVTFPDDYRAKELAGKEAEFSLKIKDIQDRVKNVKIDNQLATEMGEKDLESLKKKISEKMQFDFEKFSALKIRREITEKLIKLYKFDIPSKMVDDEKKFLKSQSPKESDSEINKQATRRVKLGLILNSIGKKNTIEVTDQDLTKAVVAEAQKYPGEEKKIVDFYQKNPQMMDNLRGIAFEEKVMSFLSNVCKANNKKTNFDELFKSEQLKPEKQIISNNSNKGKEK